MLGKTFKQNPEAFSEEVKRKVARNIAEDLIAYLIEGMPRNESIGFFGEKTSPASE